MNRRFYLSAALAALVLSMIASSAPAHVLAAQPGDTTSPVTFPFATHITMGLPEQDVFVNHNGAPTDQVFRLGVNDAKDAAVLGQQVYASSSVQGHDPFGMGGNPMGPYPAGEALGFTMGQWLSAGGTVTYSCAGGQSSVSGKLNNLVPGGQYTVWHTRLTFPPNVNVVDRPLGAADGSQNGFKADAAGNGSFNVSFTGCLEETTKETATLIVTAYHSDGRTYGAVPGDFGRVTHVQNIAMLPPAAASTPGMPTTGAGPSDSIWVLLALAVLCLAAGSRARRHTAGSKTLQ
jgi:hypothetical protein